MARGWTKFEGDVKRLISKVTGFEPYEENFGLCLQFAQSNILHHQFLSVDSHKTRRTLTGLEEKFAVHSDEKKAKTLKELSERFLDSPVFEHKENGKTDTHYAILSLLACLAVAPTQATYQPCRPHKEQEVEGEFDWKSYLLGGEDVYSGPFPSTPEWSEDEDDYEYAYSTTSHLAPRYSSSPRSHSQLPSVDPVPALPLVTDDSKPSEENEQWLLRNIMTQYWDSHVNADLDLGQSRETFLSTDWDDFLLSQNHLYVPANDVILTEYQVLREVLWMVAGMQTTFVFVVTDGIFTVRPDIQMVHLTKDALNNLLGEATEYGNVILKLSGFIEKVTSSLCCYDEAGRPDQTTCQTYQAFVGVLSKVIQEFRDQLMALEKEVAAQETPTTLLHLMEDLRRWLPQLHLLDKVYEEGVVTAQDGTNVERASNLLTVLYATLIDLDTLEQDVPTMVLFLRLWAATSRPYWDIVDRWISQGKLSDPYKEFLIQRNESMTSLDEDFWNAAFTLYIPGSMDTPKSTYLTAPQSTDSSAQQKSHSCKPGMQKGQQGEDIREEDSVSSTAPFAPDFLQPVIRQIIMTGKSMEMLSALGRLGDIVDDHRTQDGVQDSLYESFIKALQKRIGTKSDDGTANTDCTTASTHDISTSGEHVRALNCQMQDQIIVKDPLLGLNFNAIFDKDVFRCKPLMEKDKKLEERLLSLDVGHLVPIRLLLDACLYPYILDRYKRVCRHLLDVLKSDYHLISYFTAMRDFFLMEAGDTMYDFYMELFDKLRLHESWHDMSFLNMSLQEALASHYPEHIDRLYVSISDSISNSEGNDDITRRMRDRQPINALDDLRMHYKTPWPINVVLNPQSFRVYNSVFSFLLQIKRSKYCLDRLCFFDLQRPRDVPRDPEDHLNIAAANQAATRDKRIRRMHLFRMKLMYFINNLHNYIMTRILHSTGLEFLEALSTAVDLDDIIRLHMTYVGHLHERCLLHHMVRFLKVTVTKIMNLALTLQVCWDGGVDTVGEDHLKRMETDFGNCIQFLGSFLNSVVKQGSHPHLESLAYALLTSSERGRTPDTKTTSDGVY